MAERASRDKVAADMQPPNWRGAVQIIRHSIVKKKAKVQEVNQAIGEDWAKVTGYKVNKKAGVVFGMLDKLEHEERTDFMRSLNGLIDAAGWDKEAADLADLAEGNVVHLRVGGSSETGGEREDDEGDEAEMQEVVDAFEEPAAPKGDVKARAAAAKAAAARKVKGGAEEPYTGDNSDLAPE